MSQALPARPNLDWLRKTAKQQLDALRKTNPDAKLAGAQLALAREYGFPSWRTLKAEVDRRQALASKPELVNAIGPHPFWGGRPQPLHVSIETKRHDMFDLLIAAGANISGDNEQYDHWSPL